MAPVPCLSGVRLVIPCILLALISACGSDHPEEMGEYLAWVNDPDNGLVAVQGTNSGRTSLKLLPTDYLIARDRQGTSASGGDSTTLRRRYDSCLYFLLTMERPASAAQTVHDRPISSSGGMEPLQQLSLTGELREMFALRCGGRDIASVAAWAEATSGLAPAQNVVVVFPRHQMKDSDSIEVTFDGRSFNAGTQKFRFDTRNLARTPHN